MIAQTPIDIMMWITIMGENAGERLKLHVEHKLIGDKAFRDKMRKVSKNDSTSR